MLDHEPSNFSRKVNIQGGPKSKPLPSDQKIVLNRIKPVNEIRSVVKLKYESSTIILFVGTRYSIRDLLSDLNTMPDPQTIAMCRTSDTVNDVSASSGISPPQQAVNSMSKRSLRWRFM